MLDDTMLRFGTEGFNAVVVGISETMEGERVIGIYLTNRHRGHEFDQPDEQIMTICTSDIKSLYTHGLRQPNIEIRTKEVGS